MSAAWLAPWQRPPRKAPPRPVPEVPTLPAGMAEEFEDMPLGGGIAYEPAPQSAIPVETWWAPPPPDWEAEAAALPPKPEPQPEPPDALTAIHDPDDYQPDDWQPAFDLGPPGWFPVDIPAPDWRGVDR